MTTEDLKQSLFTYRHKRRGAAMAGDRELATYYARHAAQVSAYLEGTRE